MEKQIAACTSISAHFLKAGEKSSALEFHKLKKTFAADISTLKSQLISTNENDLIPPPFVYNDVQYSMERQIEELSVTDLEIGIIRCVGLNHKEISNPSSLEVI